MDQTEINVQFYKSIGEASFLQLSLLLSPDCSPTNCHTVMAQLLLVIASISAFGQSDAKGQSRVIWRSHVQFDLASCPVRYLTKSLAGFEPAIKNLCRP
jgi:hypothetical protein